VEAVIAVEASRAGRGWAHQVVSRES